MSEDVVIITGAASGIGLACARRFFEDGYNVVLADSDEAAGLKAAKDIDSEGRRAIFVPCDVSDRLSVHNLMAMTLNHFGRVDILINNASLAISGGLLNLSLDDFDRVMNTNLRGSFLVSRAVARFMVDEIDNREDRSRLNERSYAIINMTSIHDRMVVPGHLSYCASKGGLQQMTKVMAAEFAAYGIRVNAVGAEHINAALQSYDIENDAGGGLFGAPLGRRGQADEVAAAAVFLASNDASYITGQTIYVDGGRLAVLNMPPKDKDAPED